MNKAPLLLNPGPVTLSERVRNALLKADLCHREPEFAELVRGVRAKLSHVYATESCYEPVLLTGSGTAAVEAMLQTFCPVDRPVLVLTNGVYGERMAAMLAAQGKPHEILRAEWLSGIDLNGVARILSGGKFAYMLCVHHETTTGRLNDLPGLQTLAQQLKVPILLDCVSSFGGEQVNFDSASIVAVAGTANKCLHSVPGVSFVIATKHLLESASHSRSLYFDLVLYARQQQGGFSPFTQAVHAVYALSDAMDEFFEQGGVAARSADYYKKSRYVVEELQKQGIQTLLPEASAYSGVLVSFHVPRWTSYEKLHTYLKKNGFVIYAGQGSFEGEIFRIAVMGAVRMQDLERLVTLFAEFRKQNA